MCKVVNRTESEGHAWLGGTSPRQKLRALVLHGYKIVWGWVTHEEVHLTHSGGQSQTIQHWHGGRSSPPESHHDTMIEKQKWAEGGCVWKDSCENWEVRQQ